MSISVLPIPKATGDAFGANITFKYKGTGGDFYVGCMVEYPPYPLFMWRAITLAQTFEQWEDYGPYTVSGIWDGILDHEARVSCELYIKFNDGYPATLQGKLVGQEYGYPWYYWAPEIQEVDYLRASFW